MEKIVYPEHLNEHNIPPSVLESMPASLRQSAIESNTTNRKLDWMIEQMVFTRNLLVDHDKALDLWKRVCWGFGVLTVLAVTLHQLGIWK